MNIFRIFGNHEIDDWRDDSVTIAATILNHAAAAIIADLEVEVKGASWKDGLVGPRGFIASRIAPRVRETAEPIVAKIVEEANVRLAAIVRHEAIWHDRPALRTADSEHFEGWTDVALAAGPLATGIAVTSALPVMAVTTTTAFFGLVTTSVVSWPVVIGGSAIAGVALVTGVVNTARIWDKTESRLRRKVHDHVVETLLQGSRGEPAILQQLTAAFAKAADEAKKL